MKAGETGSLLSRRTWLLPSFTVGFVAGWPIYFNTVEFAVNERRYQHGRLLTMWVNYDYDGILPGCNLQDYVACPEGLRLTYKLNYRGPDGVSGSAPAGQAPAAFTPGGVSALAFHRDPANPPTDYKHFVVWFPRAAGSPRSFELASAFTLAGGGVVNRGTILASSAPEWRWP